MTILEPDTDTGTPVDTGDGLLVTPSSLYSGVFVKVDMHTHVSGVVKVTVTRTANGTTETVRGMDAVPTPDGFLAGFDHEAPRGVTCTYQATCATYATGFADTAVIAGPALLKHPLDPRLSCSLGVDAYPEWVDGISDNVIRIIGRSAPIVTDDGVRWTGEGSLTGVTRDPFALAELRALLATGGGPFLLQPSAVSGEPDMWVHIRTTKRSRPFQSSLQPRRNHDLPLVEIVRPDTVAGVLDVVVPGHTYEDLSGTWASQLAASYFAL